MHIKTYFCFQTDKVVVVGGDIHAPSACDKYAGNIKF